MADSLILENKKKVAKRGRPSQGIEAEHAAKKTHVPTAPIPSTAVRADDTGHWPVFSEKRGSQGEVGCRRCDASSATSTPASQRRAIRAVPPIKLYCVIDIMFLLFNLHYVLYFLIFYLT